MARRRFMVGNWKMNGTALALGEAEAIALAAAHHPAVDVALCPPATLINRMAAAAPTLRIGGQDCHDAPAGAYTGCLSAEMLVDAGARLVIVGHSERRSGFGETDTMVRAKALAALDAGLSVIICVGESLTVRETGNAEPHVLAQVSGSLPPLDDQNVARIAIAYEPNWAIGTGHTATPADIIAMHGAIRSALGAHGETIRLLYGGSVAPENVASIMACRDVDGALVGGASLTAAKFVPLIEVAAA